MLINAKNYKCKAVRSGVCLKYHWLTHCPLEGVHSIA